MGQLLWLVQYRHNQVIGHALVVPGFSSNVNMYVWLSFVERWMYSVAHGLQHTIGFGFSCHLSSDLLMCCCVYSGSDILPSLLWVPHYCC